MTPEQRMEVVRWMLDSIDRIVEKSEPLAIVTSSYTGNQASENVKAAEAAVGEREETKPCSCHTSMKCLVAANDLAPGFHCILDKEGSNDLVVRQRLMLMSVLASKNELLSASEGHVTKLTAELAEVRRQHEQLKLRHDTLRKASKEMVAERERNTNRISELEQSVAAWQELCRDIRDNIRSNNVNELYARLSEALSYVGLTSFPAVLPASQAAEVQDE